jgi:Tfp pilus assembly protein PilF
MNAYELALQHGPNRFRALYGLAKAADRAGDHARARASYAKVVTLATQSESQRPELLEARAFVAKP